MTKILVKSSIKLIQKFRNQRAITDNTFHCLSKVTSHFFHRLHCSPKSNRPDSTGLQISTQISHILEDTEARTNVKRVHHSKLEAAAGLSLTSCRFVRTGGRETRYAADQIIRSNLLFQAGINSGRARSGQWTLYRERSAASVCYLSGYVYHVYRRQQDPQIPDRHRDEPRPGSNCCVVPVSDLFVASPPRSANNSCVDKCGARVEARVTLNPWRTNASILATS